MTIAVTGPRVRPFSIDATDTPAAEAVAAPVTDLPQSLGVDGGEIVLLHVKPSMWRPLFDSMSWIITCCAVATVLVTARLSFPGLSLAASAQLVLLVGLARLGLAGIRWVPTWYVLTNRRVINARGVRRMRIEAYPLTKLRNTCVIASTPERATRLGTIVFMTADREGENFAWRSIANADEVHSRIRRAIEHAYDDPGTL